MIHTSMTVSWSRLFRLPKNSEPVLPAATSEHDTIVSTPEVLGGKPRIAGRRIAVQHIAIWRNRLGMSVDEIAREYDLSPEDVRTALAYYYSNRAVIDADIQEEETLIAELERQAKPLVRR